MRGGSRLACLIAWTIAIAAVPTPAHADQVDELTALLSDSNAKTRLQATLSLARLGDKRTLRPLVGALKDPMPQVRTIAATALGKLGHKAAMPALKVAAADDHDPTVRDKAREAYDSIAKANGIAEPAAPAVAQARTQAKAPGFGRSPRAVEDRPDLYVMIKGTVDDSPGQLDKISRKANADALRTSLSSQLKSAPQVTMAATEAQRWGLDARHLDVSVVKLEVVQSASMVEVATELRLAISDDKGKMLSFLSGGAKVQVPKSKFNAKYLPSLRRQALESAVQGMFGKLLVHLRQIATT